MTLVLALEPLSIGTLVLAGAVILALVLLWKTLKFAFKIGLIVVAGFLLYRAAVAFDLIPGA